MSIMRWVLLAALLTVVACGDESSDTMENELENPGDGDGDGDAAGDGDGDGDGPAAGQGGDGDGDPAGDGDGDGGDGDGDGAGAPDAGGGDDIEIAGTWYNVTLDLVETFSSTAITGDFVPVEIAAYDNALNVMVLRFDDEADPSQSIYTKVVWLEPDASGFYYCPIAFELTSIEDALAAEDTSDASDPEAGGCDGAPWTHDVPVDEMPER